MPVNRVQLKLAGTTRIVILWGKIALKLPNVRRWRLFLHGLLANLQERTFGTLEGCCPVLCSDPLGFALVMRRARPLSDEEWAAFDYEGFIHRQSHRVPAENKRDSFGWLDGEIVAVDYGS